MADTSNLKLIIAFTDPNLDDEEKEDEVQKLLAQLKELDEVEEVDRVRNPNPPEGSKEFFVREQETSCLWAFHAH